MRAALILLCCTGWFAERKIDRNALNILVRRLEAIRDETDDPEIKESARKCLYHLDALYVRRGRVDEEDWIVLDSPDEERIIMQAMGLAGIKEARAGFWREAWNATGRRLWRKVKSVVLHNLPLGMIGLWLWMSRKRLMRAVFQYDKGVEQLDDDKRHAFKGRDLERVHARFKAKGTL